MPGGTTLARAWIFEWLVLESQRRESDALAIGQKAHPIGGDEMRHRSTVPGMAV
jgi:hypothetical protein